MKTRIEIITIGILTIIFVIGVLILVNLKGLNVLIIMIWSSIIQILQNKKQQNPQLMQVL